MAVEQH